MSESSLHFFADARGATAVALPFSLDQMIADLGKVRRAMIHEMPEEFRRDEWAYLIAALAKDELMAPFVAAFGRASGAPDDKSPVNAVARPRGTAAVWLPANVSLLGPLVLVLLLLSGNRVLLKGTARATDLTQSFLAFARQHAPDGQLADALRSAVLHEIFDRDDERNAEWLAQADLRLLFGSNAAAAALEKLSHPLESLPVYFVDRRSEAWLTTTDTTDEILRDLLRVFAIYGQAGCTSPSRVVLLDASLADAVRVRDRLLELWSSTVRGHPAPSTASSNVLAWQWALANGWDAKRSPRNAAVIAAGTLGLAFQPAAMLLPIIAASEREADAALPSNIQTIGVVTAPERRARWLKLAAGTRALRVVPLRDMHRFSSVWDGRRFFADAFEIVEARV